MTQALSGAAIAAVIAVCWLLGRPRPRRILRSTDTAAVAALNRGQIERLISTAASDSDGPGASAQEANQPASSGWPRDVRGRAQLLRRLEGQFAAGGGQRREAIQLCAAWRHRATLPLLRRALRDGDPTVVALAAEAMTAFRGHPAVAAQAAGKAVRNVSRTR